MSAYVDQARMINGYYFEVFHYVAEKHKAQLRESVYMWTPFKDDAPACGSILAFYREMDCEGKGQ